MLGNNFEILENRDNVAEKLPCKWECTNIVQCSNRDYCRTTMSIGAAVNSSVPTLIKEIPLILGAGTIPLTSGADLISGAEIVPLIK